MDVKPGSKSGATAGMKPPSSDSNVNMSLASRIDQALEDEKNRREQLSRRPSYRKILKELGGSKAVNTSEQLAASDDDGEDGLSGEESPNGPANNGDQSHKLASGAKQLATSSSNSQQPTTGAPVILLPHALASAGNTQSPALRNTRSPNNGTQANSFEVHDTAAVGASPSSSTAQISALAPSHHFVGLIPAGLNMVQMEGASQQLGTLLANAAQPAAILQYAQQGLDGQLYIPAAANMQAYQVAAAASANSAAFNVSNTQQLFVTTAPSGSTSAASSNSPLGAPHGGGGDDSTRKREMRLLKNREAARECRRKKKEYVKCLENRVAVLESQNKTLIEELKALKELYCSKDAPTGSGQPPSATVPQS